MDVNTLELVRENLESYFNGPLKKSLNYPDDIRVEIGDNYNTFIITFTHDERSFPYNDEKILNEIRLQLLNALQLLNVREIIIKYDTLSEMINAKFYTTLTIELLFQPFQLEEIPDIGIYVNIAASLTLNQLNNLCSVDKTFQQLCKSQELWSELFMDRYPGYPYERLRKILNKDQINFQRLYKGILFYEENIHGKVPKIQPGVIRPPDQQKKYGEMKNNIETMLGISVDSFIFLVKLKIISKHYINSFLSLILKVNDVNLINTLREMYPELLEKS